MHDHQFTATGPSHHTSGFPKTAFSTGSPSDFLHGVNVQDARCGVVGEGLQAEADTPPGSSAFPGVGVEGKGANFGVVGIGRQDAIAGVYGHGNRCKIGVLGAVMDRRGGERIGVVGASVSSLGNPLGTLDSIPEPADGSGTGVLGTSGKGPGVSGSSSEGSGGEFSSQSGAGISAVSEKNRAGVFKAGQNVAQINLVPLVQGTQELSFPGKATSAIYSSSETSSL